VEDTNISNRFLYAMGLSVVMAVLTSALFMPWRVTTGLLLGGALSLLSYSWMSSSVASAFNAAANGTRPQIKIVTYVLRYFVITIVVYGAYKLNVISLPAALLGMCSFVVALFAEASRNLYHSIVHREEIT
jgi:hypothetical protein